MEFKKLKELVEINSESITKNYKETIINYLDTANITNGKIDSIVEINIKDAPSRAKRIVRENDIVYSTVRPNLCHYGILREICKNMIVSTGFVVLRCKEEILPEYLYAYITLPDITMKLHAIAETSTSAYPSIKPSDLEDIDILILPKEIQKKISSILTNIDKKIELNNQINNNLLESIKTLYIEKIKNNNDINFEEKTLDEFCNIFTGKKNANASEENGQYKFFTCAPEPLSINSYIYDGPAVIVAGNGAYTGRTNFYKGKFDLYQRTYGITTNNDYIYLFYAMIYTDLQNNIMGGTHGSAIPYIVMNDIAKFKVKYNKELFDELSQEIKVLLLKIKSNEGQNEILEQLRDALLPKLMNGEIDLDKIEI